MQYSDYLRANDFYDSYKMHLYNIKLICTLFYSICDDKLFNSSPFKKIKLYIISYNTFDVNNNLHSYQTICITDYIWIVKQWMKLVNYWQNMLYWWLYIYNCKLFKIPTSSFIQCILDLYFYFYIDKGISNNAIYLWINAWIL